MTLPAPRRAVLAAALTAALAAPVVPLAAPASAEPGPDAPTLGTAVYGSTRTLESTFSFIGGGLTYSVPADQAACLPGDVQVVPSNAGLLIRSDVVMTGVGRCLVDVMDSRTETVARTESIDVTPAPLVLKPSTARTYGATGPSAPVFNALGLVNGDTLADEGEFDLGGATVADATDSTTPVGTYPATGAGATASNYTISYRTGRVRVTPAVLTVTVQDSARYVGHADPRFEYRATGWVGPYEYELPGTARYTATKATQAGPVASSADSPAGTYLVSVTGLQALDNYKLRYVRGRMLVTKAPATPVASLQAVPGTTAGTWTATLRLTGFAPDSEVNLQSTFNDGTKRPGGYLDVRTDGQGRATVPVIGGPASCSSTYGLTVGIRTADPSFFLSTSTQRLTGCPA